MRFWFLGLLPVLLPGCDDDEGRAALIKRMGDAADGIPVVAMGRILEPAQGEALLADGVAELVGLGRTMVTDAAWALKSMQGRDNDIRKCVSCNNCWGVINDGIDSFCRSQDGIARRNAG